MSHEKLNGREFNIPHDRVLTGEWDGKPITRRKTPYEKFCDEQRKMGAKVPTPEEFNLYLALLGSPNYKPGKRI